MTMVKTETLQRDLTETLFRLKLARTQRNLKEAEVQERRLNWLLERLYDRLQGAVS